MAADPEQVRAEVRGHAAGDVWIEKVKLAPTGAAQADQSTLSEDAASELQTALQELRGQPDDIRAVLAAGDCGRLLNRLPPDIRTAFEQSLDDVFACASALLQARPSESAP